MFLFVPFPLYILIFPEIWVFYQVGIFHVKFFRFPMFWSFNIKTVQRSRQVWKVRGLAVINHANFRELAEINHANFREFRKVFPLKKKKKIKFGRTSTVSATYEMYYVYCTLFPHEQFKILSFKNNKFNKTYVQSSCKNCYPPFSRILLYSTWSFQMKVLEIFLIQLRKFPQLQDQHSSHRFFILLLEPFLCWVECCSFLLTCLIWLTLMISVQ